MPRLCLRRSLMRTVVCWTLWAGQSTWWSQPLLCHLWPFVRVWRWTGPAMKTTSQ